MADGLEQAQAAGEPAGILAACYDEMRRIARRLVATEALRVVFQPTALANEAVLRLLQSGAGHVQSCSRSPRAPCAAS